MTIWYICMPDNLLWLTKFQKTCFSEVYTNHSDLIMYLDYQCEFWGCIHCDYYDLNC